MKYQLVILLAFIITILSNTTVFAVESPVNTSLMGVHGHTNMYDVTNFGAIPDGKTLDTQYIQRAIDTCYAAGGGTVYFPSGIFLSGTIQLKDNITIYLAAGATLLGSSTMSDYQPKHLFYAHGVSNIAIAGMGCIDGRGNAFWKLRPENERIKEEDRWHAVAHFSYKPKDRPSPLLYFDECRHIVIQDIIIKNAPGWTITPFKSSNCLIHGVTIDNPIYGPNTDGIDIDDCEHVTISDCQITTGDDAVCLKNSNASNIPFPCRNIAITNCILTTACNAFKIGTGTLGDFENITFTNSVIYNEPQETVNQALSGVAIESVDGGHVHNVLVANITMQNVRSPIFIRLGNRVEHRKTNTPGTLRDININNILATGAMLTCIFTGLPKHPIENVHLANIDIHTLGSGTSEKAISRVPENPGNYPECVMFGRWLPSNGFYCRHIKGISFSHVQVTAETVDTRPMFMGDDVESLTTDHSPAIPDVPSVH
ncbi:MAG TPA: glycosyl hydrolase family 28 protein [Armatimonadota bacterium]|nr:glycosyl hydrolase family 28 protein [Armatimonadota bacterium]